MPGEAAKWSLTLSLLLALSVKPTCVGEVQSIASRDSCEHRECQHGDLDNCSRCRLSKGRAILPSALRCVLNVFFNEHSSLLPTNLHWKWAVVSSAYQRKQALVTLSGWGSTRRTHVDHILVPFRRCRTPLQNL